MAGHFIIAIGASAGGIGALTELTKRLPPGLPASLFVVVHFPASHRSELAEILSRSGPLPASQAFHGQIYEPGQIYVAPPDYHMLIEGGEIHLWRGPKENGHRPAVNALFRSAAVAHRQHVAGVILSGTLDDGTTGLWWIKRYGGITVVQDPEDALFPEMIYSALEHVNVDHILPVAKMGELMRQLADCASGRSRGVSQPAASKEVNRKWSQRDQ